MIVRWSCTLGCSTQRTPICLSALCVLCGSPGEISPDQELSELTITGADLLDQHEFINHPLKSSIQRALGIELRQELDFFAYLKVMTVFNVMGPLEPKVNLLFQLFQPGGSVTVSAWLSQCLSALCLCLIASLSP